MIEYLRPKEIAARLGVSNKFTNRLIRKSTPPEKKREDGKTLFEYYTILDYIRKQA